VLKNRATNRGLRKEFKDLFEGGKGFDKSGKDIAANRNRRGSGAFGQVPSPKGSTRTRGSHLRRLVGQIKGRPDRRLKEGKKGSRKKPTTGDLRRWAGQACTLGKRC